MYLINVSENIIRSTSCCSSWLGDGMKFVLWRKSDFSHCISNNRNNPIFYCFCWDFMRRPLTVKSNNLPAYVINENSVKNTVLVNVSTTRTIILLFHYEFDSPFGTELFKRCGGMRSMYGYRWMNYSPFDWNTKAKCFLNIPGFYTVGMKGEVNVR